jgi:hypothetical protein
MSTTVLDAILVGLTAIGISPSDTLTVNASVAALTNNVAITRNIGVAAPTGATVGLQYRTTVSGDPSGNSDVRASLHGLTLSGSYGAALVNARSSQLDLTHTAGTVASSIYDLSYIRLGRLGSSTGNVNSVRGYDFHVANEGSGNIGTAVWFSASDVDLLDGTGFIDTAIGFRVGNLGHASRVRGAAIGFDSANMTGGAPLTVSYRSMMTAAPGKWALYFPGGASSAHAGKVRVGSTTPPAATLDVSGDVSATQYVLPGGVGIYSGPGIPAFTAARGSLYLRTDGSGQHYRNSDGSTGWIEK